MKWERKIWALMICMALLCGTLVGCGNGSNGAEKMDKPVLQRVRVGDTMGIVYGEMLLMTEYDNGFVEQSLDGTSGIFTNDGIVLHLYNGEAVKIAQQAKRSTISVSGEGVAYTLNEESGHEDDLYLYDGRTGETVQIHSATDGVLDQYILSPDGKTVVYVVYQQKLKIMVYQNGKHQQLLETTNWLKLISTDNSTNTIYYWEGGNLKTINLAGEVKVLGRLQNYAHTGEYTPGMFYANADHTELFYAGKDGRMLSVNGGEGTLLYERRGMESSHIELMEPANSTRIEEGYLITCNVETFMGQTMRSSGSILLQGEDGKYAPVAKYNQKEMWQSWLDPTGSYFYYVNTNQELYVIDLRNGGQETKLAEKVKGYVVANDCSVVYYYDDLSDYGGSLYRCNGKDGSDVKKIEVEFTNLIMSGSNQLYTLKGSREEADLYKVSSRGKAELVLENVQWYSYRFQVIDRFVLCGEDVYLLQDGELLKLEQKKVVA